MTDTRPISDHVSALRVHLARHPPTEGFHLITVREDSDEVAVVFRWKVNPHTFVIRFGTDFAGPYSDAEMWPEGQDPLEAWCDDVQFWLMEELDTGLLTRAARRREGEEIVLVLELPTDLVDEGVWVTDVPQYAREVRLPWRIGLRMAPRMLLAHIRGREASFGWTAWAPLDESPGDGLRDGEWLAKAGLDPARVRVIRDEARLLVWLQAMGDGSVDDPAFGQCVVVSTDDPEVALVEVLETAGGAPTSARQWLVDGAVHAAADLGARTVLVPDVTGGHERIDTALC